MNDAGFSLADIRAATAGNNYDGMGCGNGWFWIIILLIFGGGFNRYNGESPLVSDEFIKRDIFNTNQNISSTACQTQRDVLEAKYDTELAVSNLGSQMQNCCCETNRNVDSVKYDTLLNFKDMQAQLASCCCDLKTAIHAEGEETRQLIQGNVIQDLRDRLAASQRETDTANLALQNNAQTNTILNSLGRFVTNPGVPLSVGCGCNYGCGYVTPTIV